jgi:pimeloyl-ACP methyl ester carboxylesterase
MHTRTLRPQQTTLCIATLASFVLSACSTDAPSDAQRPEFSYPAPTEVELQTVVAKWQQRDLSARSVVLLTEDAAANYTVRLYEHLVGGNTHYGAVSIPKGAQPASVPVVLFADSLNQNDPTIDVGLRLRNAEAVLPYVIFVIPAFRGRTLIYKGLSFPASGDFCDAYDGAADDAIALLNVIETQVNEADFSRVMVRGGSRGGNTALLLAERDPRVKVAVAIAAPTDFNRVEPGFRYKAQFDCQFIDGKSAAESREKILASSPLHFPVLPSVSRVHLLHGRADQVVSVWNADEMAARLRAQGVDVDYRSYEGYGHEDIGMSPAFQAAQQSIFERFLTTN